MDQSQVEEPRATEYAGFWPRLGAFGIDGLIVLPLFFLSMLARRWSPSAALVGAVVYFLSVTAYHVISNATRGATPGKRFLKIEIRRVDGLSIGWREAWLRSSVDILLGAVSCVALGIVLLGIDPADYQSVGYSRAMVDASPPWRDALTYLSNAWFLAEIAVFFLNDRRRAVHDFIAGTVVVRSHASA